MPLTIAFGGSFFALADADGLGLGDIGPETAPAYARLGMLVRDEGEPHSGREPSDARHRHGGPRGVLGAKGA
ncbi:MAG TPA: hypothetical protein OIL86_09235 [Eggerthellaceae bacterium]|nr:hypothetical protein [Eggerthellaceae bacterium]